MDPIQPKNQVSQNQPIRAKKLISSDPGDPVDIDIPRVLAPTSVNNLLTVLGNQQQLGNVSVDAPKVEPRFDYVLLQIAQNNNLAKSEEVLQEIPNLQLAVDKLTQEEFDFVFLKSVATILQNRILQYRLTEFPSIIPIIQHELRSYALHINKEAEKFRTIYSDAPFVPNTNVRILKNGSKDGVKDEDIVRLQEAVDFLELGSDDDINYRDHFIMYNNCLDLVPMECRGLQSDSAPGHTKIQDPYEDSTVHLAITIAHETDHQRLCVCGPEKMEFINIYSLEYEIPRKDRIADPVVSKNHTPFNYYAEIRARMYTMELIYALLITVDDRDSLQALNRQKKDEIYVVEKMLTALNNVRVNDPKVLSEKAKKEIDELFFTFFLSTKGFVIFSD